MSISRDQVLADTLELLDRQSEDWEYSGEITEDTDFLSDMGLQSLDVVILANAIQERYATVMPFADFFAELEGRERQDLSVREWVDFVYRHLDTSASLRNSA